jgi:hypothetical protein
MRGIMKNWGLWVSAFGLATVGSVYAAERSSEIDFKAANPVMQALLDAVTLGDDIIDYAYPKFDESVSSLKEDRIKYDFHGSCKNTPWKEGGRADVTATSTYVAERNPQDPGVRVTGAANIRTDVLALIRHAAYIALKKSCCHDPAYAARIEAHLKRLAVAQSLQEVNDLFLSGQLLTQEIVQSQVAEHEAYLECLVSGPCAGNAGQIEYQRKKVAHFKGMLEGYKQARIEAASVGGKITQLTVTSPDANLFFEHGRFDVFPQKLRLVLGTEALSASGEVFARMTMEKLNKLHADLGRRINGAIAANPEDVDYVQAQYRWALVEFKKFIRGEIHP